MIPMRRRKSWTLGPRLARRTTPEQRRLRPSLVGLEARVVLSPPTIVAISPATGPTAGGVPVTIDGATSVQVAPSRSPDRHSPPRP